MPGDATVLPDAPGEATTDGVVDSVAAGGLGDAWLHAATMKHAATTAVRPGRTSCLARSILTAAIVPDLRDPADRVGRGSCWPAARPFYAFCAWSQAILYASIASL
jgi:hypothetical protein